jgi:hypothetical protein
MALLQAFDPPAGLKDLSKDNLPGWSKKISEFEDEGM